MSIFVDKRPVSFKGYISGIKFINLSNQNVNTMKKLLMTLIGVAAVVMAFNTRAQQTPQFRSKSDYMAWVVSQNEQLLQKCDFMFVPLFAQIQGDELIEIEQFEYLSVTSDTMDVVMSRYDRQWGDAPENSDKDIFFTYNPLGFGFIETLSVYTPEYNVIKNQPARKKNSWEITLRSRDELGVVTTFGITVDCKTSEAVVRVISEKGSWTYIGKIAPNSPAS